MHFILFLHKEGSGTKLGGIECAINQNQPYLLPLMSSNMQHTTVVNVETTFKESNWIGVNKKFQKVPPEVSDARDALLQVPKLHSKLFFFNFKHSRGQILHSGQVLALNKARYIVRTNF